MTVLKIIWFYSSWLRIVKPRFKQFGHSMVHLPLLVFQTVLYLHKSTLRWKIFELWRGFKQTTFAIRLYVWEVNVYMYVHFLVVQILIEVQWFQCYKCNEGAADVCNFHKYKSSFTYYVYQHWLVWTIIVLYYSI